MKKHYADAKMDGGMYERKSVIVSREDLVAGRCDSSVVTGVDNVVSDTDNAGEEELRRHEWIQGIECLNFTHRSDFENGMDTGVLVFWADVVGLDGGVTASTFGEACAGDEVAFANDLFIAAKAALRAGRAAASAVVAGLI